MKKKIILFVLLTICMLSISACVKEEEKKAEDPIENAGDLMADILGETEPTTEEETGETESIDYDKLDEQLMQEMIAGGAATDVVQAGSAGASSGGTASNGEISLGGIYYKADNWNFYQEKQGMNIYTRNNSLESVGIYAINLNMGTSLKDEVILAYEMKLEDIYGAYSSKTQYTNDNGVTFNSYKYNTNKLSNNLIVEVFLYTNGNTVVYIESGVARTLGGITQYIYNFVDSVRLK